jgi:hypothetical protein
LQKLLIQPLGNAHRQESRFFKNSGIVAAPVFPGAHDDVSSTTRDHATSRFAANRENCLDRWAKVRMDFTLSDKQRNIQCAVEQFARGEFDPDLGRELDETGKFPESIWKKACQLGFVGVQCPREFGGSGYMADQEIEEYYRDVWAIGAKQGYHCRKGPGWMTIQFASRHRSSHMFKCFVKKGYRSAKNT